jgi:Protein of unknown function (DUF3224)
MRKLLYLAVGAVAAATAIPASATPPTPVTGTFAVVTATPTSTRTADGNTFTTLTRTAALSGTFTGTTTDTVTLVMHSNGTTSLRGAGTCVCTVEGRTGTFDYRFSGAGTFPTSVVGRFVAGHGTGGLEGLHGQGSFSGNFFVAVLDGQYHFD